MYIYIPQFLKDRRNRPARSTPRGCEINHHRYTRFSGLRPDLGQVGGVGDVHNGGIGPRALIHGGRTGHGCQGLLLWGRGAETVFEPRQCQSEEDEKEGDQGAEGHTEGADAYGRHGEKARWGPCVIIVGIEV